MIERYGVYQLISGTKPHIYEAEGVFYVIDENNVYHCGQKEADAKRLFTQEYRIYKCCEKNFGEQKSEKLVEAFSELERLTDYCLKERVEKPDETLKRLLCSISDEQVDHLCKQREEYLEVDTLKTIMGIK